VVFQTEIIHTTPKTLEIMRSENEEIENPPIIEAVVDIDCDLPSSLEFQTIKEKGEAVFRDEFPIFREMLLEQHTIQPNENAPPTHEVKKGVKAYQFRSEDEKQLIQFRPAGYSFNRLAPYTSLDYYLPIIESTWKSFVEIAQPVIIRRVSIRIINKIHLPVTDGQVLLKDYLQSPPKLPETSEDRLIFSGFFEQHAAREPSTGHQVKIVRTVKGATESELTLLLDIAVYNQTEFKPDSWEDIRNQLNSIRRLKNQLFRNTLTETCLNLFSQAD